MAEMDSVSPVLPEKPKCRGSFQRWAIRGMVALGLLLLIGELVARFGLGLGDPPLMMTDPQIEYRYQPNQDCRRFGNRIRINAYSMRSDDFPEKKSDPKEFRVLFLGDSVVNGGVHTDQKNLATEILKRELAAKLKRPVVVGNISAGSWGPPNQLAYLQKYGTFDADVLVLVFNDGDIGDVPTFEPVVGVRADAPAHKPWLALQELVQRYVPAAWGGLNEQRSVLNLGQPVSSPENIQIAGQAVRDIVQTARSHGMAMMAVFCHEVSDLERSDRPLTQEWNALWSAYPDVQVMDMRQTMIQSFRDGKVPYRDDIHPNDLGQKLMADALLEPLMQAAGGSTSR